ncbi:MAG: Vms1/Ankzf1 family peptidyl-tRNA hydrolase [Nitrospirota bacterium]
MVSREELREIAKMRAEDAFFVSLYLNVNPMTNVKNNYVIHVKNMLKQTSEGLDKVVLKKVNGDLEKIEAYILANKRIFKKGLAILSSQGKNIWKEFHLSVPVKNEVIVDKTPYIKPLLDILDNYQRYAILLVGRESARLFLIHLGEIEEYTEVHSADVPGRHKKGGWFALSEKSYERHIDYHVALHLKDVLKQLDSFLSGEYVGRLIIGGSEEAVTKVRAMLPQAVSDKVIGTFQAEMFAKTKEILKKAEPILQAFERQKESEIIEDLLTKAMKNENAVIGIENVLNALQEGRVMKLLFLKDYKQSGLQCKKCGHLTIQDILSCPYCKGEMQHAKYIIDLAAQKAVEQGAIVSVISENKKLEESGSIGAFLRF